jgi:hypothetical protein
MAFKKIGFKPVEEGGVHDGTESWNIAQYYTGYSIALPLKELNELEDIARFGTVKMDDEIMMSDDQFNKRRADAVKRYWQKLKQIVSDTLFKVRTRDKVEAIKIHDWLKGIPQYFDGLLSISTDEINHEEKIELNEKFLIVLIDKLVEKKQEYLFILNHAGLIFRESDEIDLDKMSSDFVHGG